ncbi:hypothetical protein, partial [Klebsiella pneumoniae]|uniref:hypothetical protein n=1 Tax=Klebsiella pneumoniae TaxID=573 RepID=UPI003B5A2AB6
MRTPAFPPRETRKYFVAKGVSLQWRAPPAAVQYRTLSLCLSLPAAWRLAPAFHSPFRGPDRHGKSFLPLQP